MIAYTSASSKFRVNMPRPDTGAAATGGVAGEDGVPGNGASGDCGRAAGGVCVSRAGRTGDGDFCAGCPVPGCAGGCPGGKPGEGGDTGTCGRDRVSSAFTADSAAGA